VAALQPQSLESAWKPYPQLTGCKEY